MKQNRSCLAPGAGGGGVEPDAASGHGQGRCQCRHHQQKQLQAGVEEARDQLPVITETEHTGHAGQVKGHLQL